MEDDGGIELEDDYDALNDETFGSAINGDWEGIHENLVLLDTNGNTNGKSRDETDDGDLGDLGKRSSVPCVPNRAISNRNPYSNLIRF